jgi:hypothetical protein
MLMAGKDRVRPTGVHPQTAPLSYLCVLGESERVFDARDRPRRRGDGF